MPAPAFSEHYRELTDDLTAWSRIQVRQAGIAGLDADDLAQETWSRAFASFDTFDAARGTFRAWLFGIAYHVLRKHLRCLGTARRRLGEDQRPIDGCPDHGTSIVTRLGRSERAQRLVELVEELPEQDRLLVLYRGLEGLSHAEVGARLQLNPPAAETRWRRVRERLAGMLPE